MFFLAKLFGKKHVVEEDGVTVTAYFWAGKIYITDVKDLGGTNRKH